MLLGDQQGQRRRGTAKFIGEALAQGVDLATDAAESDGLSDALGIWTEKVSSTAEALSWAWCAPPICLGADGRIERVWDKVKVAGHAEDVLGAATA